MGSRFLHNKQTKTRTLSKKQRHADQTRERKVKIVTIFAQLVLSSIGFVTNKEITKDTVLDRRNEDGNAWKLHQKDIPFLLYDPVKKMKKVMQSSSVHGMLGLPVEEGDEERC